MTEVDDRLSAEGLRQLVSLYLHILGMSPERRAVRQTVLAGLRDEVAETLGLSAEETQYAFEYIRDMRSNRA